MFEVVAYIVISVAVLAFVGKSPRYAVLDIPDPTRIAELELLDELLAACNTPSYAASEMPSDVCCVVPVGEWLAPLRKAKQNDLTCMTAAELRELCREHDIPVNSRGRISQAVLDQLAAIDEIAEL